MTSKNDYMLQRNSQEFKRLNAQHEFMISLSDEHLIHIFIPHKDLWAVTNVATGTEVWLRDVAACSEFSSQMNGKKTKFVSFDISSEQFPSVEDLPFNLDFVIHDFIEPFSSEYREKFDLINVRLLSYVIKTLDLKKIVQHILQILRE